MHGQVSHLPRKGSSDIGRLLASSSMSPSLVTGMTSAMFHVLANLFDPK
jgi:hypothetical protein